MNGSWLVAVADTKENTNTEKEWLSFPFPILYISVNEYFRYVLPTILLPLLDEDVL